MSLKITVVLGSVREGRLAARVSKFVVNMLKQNRFEVTLVDPLEFDFPLLTKTFEDYENPPQKMLELSKIFRDSDAIVVVSAEYNHSIPPALTNILDHYLKEYSFKPSAIVTYSDGSFGGARAAMQLRILLAELGMPTIPTILSIPKAQEIIDQDGNLSSPSIKNKSEKFLRELRWYADALKNAREKGTPY